MESFLITRPKIQNERICEFLNDHGCKTISEPLCDIEFLKYEKSDIEELKSNEVQAVFLTSYNASKVFLDFKFDKNVNIFAVGEGCVRDIREKGYRNIFVPERPSVLELEKIFLQNNPGQIGKIFYFCGNYITRDLSISLADYKFDITNITSYLVKYHEDFSENFLEILKKKQIDNVLCYSKNNARCIGGLVKKHQFESKFSDVKIYAISKEVANELKNQRFSNVFTFGDHELLKKYYNFL